MPAFISRKQSLLILLAGLCAAGGAAVLLYYLLSGPRLGPVYDFLRERRPEPPVSREIVLIETDELAESGDIFTVLMTLSELDAAGLVIAVPVLGSAPGRIAGDEEIQRRFTEEYALLGRNIRNLFEAIRVGSVPPAESPEYVENLVELAERGRDRLTAALIRQDEAGSVQAAQAAAVFGSVLEATDLRSRSALAGLWYARPRPDTDGKLRRIAPLLSAGAENGADAAPAIEHIVYRSLKSRFSESGIVYAEQGPVLVLRKSNGEETRLPLDRDGNILIAKNAKAERGFHRLALARFREYDAADRAMRRLLQEAEALGAYAASRPEQIPLILCDYAAGLREALLEAPESQKRAEWIAARTAYLAGLEELLYGPAEMTIVGGFEEIIATETLKDEGLAKLQTLRDALIRVFVAMREQHRQLTDARRLLAETVVSSLCIMGPVSAGESGPLESSALLANSLLTGSHITPVQGFYVICWSLAAAFVLLCGIHILRPAAILIAGSASALLCAAGFCGSFIISGYWIDPFIPVAAVLAGTLVMFMIKLAILRRGARRFRMAYGPAVHKNCLRELIRSGRPSLTDSITVPAAVIAIKDPLFQTREDQEKPLEAARAAAEFRSVVAPLFKQAGAAIIAYEGDTILACFGSPPERIWLERNKTPYTAKAAVQAARFITELLRQGPRPWHFGLDWGDCTFSWSEETGYTANGRPVLRARLLASLDSRYRAQVIISGAVRAQLSVPVRKLDPPGAERALTGAELYELQIPKAP
jgi:hypothetical protein